MNKIFQSLLLFFAPGLALAADSSMSLAPPTTDVSVAFLANLFGVVDGVLHGTGSQIMGNMFLVFNAGVLGLGGIVIMYTLIVSTMNTAQEGQMLGQKWSSMWVPLRSAAGLALLMPKASGYCVMQIFVMWVIVQGVGAADKVWNAALNYLNRGGVIVQGQLDPSQALLTGNSGVATGAAGILAGQVCMIGLENLLVAQRQSYRNARDQSSGPCYGTGASETMMNFCDGAAPSGFISSVNAVTAQSNATRNTVPAPTQFTVPMPNLDATNAFAFLNGICGAITWNALDSSQMNLVQNNIKTLSSSDMETAQMSRAIAIQQMYMDLQAVAYAMVNNDPQLSAAPAMTSGGTGSSNPMSGSSSNNNPATNNNTPWSVEQFGVPKLADGSLCTSAPAGSQVATTTSTPNCYFWGPAPNTKAATLLQGTEFQNALADYNGIMMPTLNLMWQANNNSSANNAREFIQTASQQGWMMAGSYFFDLVNLNQVYYKNNSSGGLGTSGPNSTDTSQLTDTNSGLNQNSSFDVVASLNSPFATTGGCTSEFAPLCTFFQGNTNKISQLGTLISGSTGNDTGLNMPTIGKTNSVVSNDLASTVYGYLTNSTILQLPGQPGMAPLTFVNAFTIDVQVNVTKLKKMKFDCGRVWIMFFSFCLGKLLGDIFYNVIFLFLYNTFLGIVLQIINTVVVAFITIPLQGMAAIFKSGVYILSGSQITQKGVVLQNHMVNPVVALANMGAMYINFASNLWINLIGVAISSAMIFGFGVFIFPLLAMGMPLLMAWMGVMLAVGFITAYYVPILPYMIFTFGAFAWLMAVIEAMVAAPIVALGVTHPEGHEAFGKGEQAMMFLMNVFLRPSLMVIGFIAGISLTYVGVWMLNTGFDHAIAFIQSGGAAFQSQTGATWGKAATDAAYQNQQAYQSGTGGYSNWAAVYAYFFSILIYTGMYMTIVQKSFTMIAMLPDKVLRWIGGQPETIGQDSSQWTEEAKGKIEKAQEAVTRGQAQSTKPATAKIQKALGVGESTPDEDGGKVGGSQEKNQG